MTPFFTYRVLYLLFFFCSWLSICFGSNGNFAGFAFGFSPGISAITYRHFVINEEGETTTWHDHGTACFAAAANANYLFAAGSYWVIGPEIHGQYNSDNVRRLDIPTEPDVVNKAYWNYGAACKIGYAVADNHLLYILAGLEISPNQAIYHYADPIVTGNASKTLLGVLGAFGSQQEIVPHFLLSEQISYGWFDHITTHLSNGKTEKDQLRLFTALVTLSYHL